MTVSFYLCTRHFPVESIHRIYDSSRGQIEGVGDGIRDSTAIGLTYAIEDRDSESS